MLEARRAVRTLKEYHPPLAGRFGLRLDFNENTSGCSPRVLDALRALDAETLARYPDCGPMERLVAEFLGLEASAALLTNGVDEGIHLLCETYLGPRDEALIVVPTFSMYEICAQATGARVIPIPADEEFRFPAEKVLAAISPRTRLIAVANPNNPTGAAARKTDLLRIARAAPDSALLVDEAYFEFCGITVLDEIGASPNVFVARTFSKAYGLAGLRIGVLVGSPEQLRMVRRVRSPYNVNSLALACLPEALADQDYVRRYVADARNGRARLERELGALGIAYWPSQANFVLARFAGLREAFLRGMKARGILVRDRHHDPGCAGCVRITVGTAEHNERLLAALRETLNEIRRPSEVQA